MKFNYLLIVMIMVQAAYGAEKVQTKTVTKNQMEVRWYFSQDRIYFEMSAPTQGWVTIGFNTHAGITGAYLLMGNIVDQQVNVVEHSTKSPGNYMPISQLGAKPQVQDIKGLQADGQTTILFSLPNTALSRYQKDLQPGKHYTMIMAYSQDDDFQHHSIMRTSAEVRL